MVASPPLQTKTPSRNLILSSLPVEMFDWLLPYLEPVKLPQGRLLVKPEEPIQWLYFLEHGMASITNAERSGIVVEVGIIGREGVVGLQALMDQTSTATTILMQGAGSGFRVRSSLLAEGPINGEMLRSSRRFLFALLEQSMQLVLCNRLHSLESRLARWLLMAREVLEVDTLQLTQEFLAQMLGSGRPGVTLAAGALQKAGLIVYNRGTIQILERELLEEVSCECYGVVRRIYSKAFPELKLGARSA